MKLLALVLVCGTAALGRPGVATEPPISVEQLPPECRLSLDGVGFAARQERAFHSATGGVVVEGWLSFEPADQTVRLEGTYRTLQPLDSRAKLSYQLLTDEGCMLQFDGKRFDWHERADGGREANFRIELAQAKRPGLMPGFRVQFNYVVEHEFWYRDRFPEAFLPVLSVRGPVRPAQFAVRWAWIPPVLPLETSCVVPAWVRQEFSSARPPYSAALDVLTAQGMERIEAPRQPLPQWKRGEGLLFYDLEETSGRSVRLRPGFVWDGVEWFDVYSNNPYREVWLAGPLEYVAGLTLAGLTLFVGWCGLARVRSRGLRRAGYGLWTMCALGFLSVVAVNFYLAVVAGITVIWWLQRRMVEPGPRAYWTLWVFLVLLDIYWGHINTGGRGLWAGTLLSACLAALLLVPLRWVRSPAMAAALGVGVGLLATFVAMSMAVYFTFFRDYPGLRDLLYAGQVGEAGDSLVALIGQRHLVPWWLWACATVGLWRR